MKKLILRFLLLSFAFSLLLNSPFEGGWGMLLAQPPPTEEWVARYPGPSNDLYGPFLAVDKQGNSYIAGTHVNDSLRILVAKYNTSGVQQWSTLYKYPGYGYFTPTGLALDSSGNAYVIAGFGLTFLTPRNGLIAKFNSSDGSLVWVKRYIGEYVESGFYDIKIDRLNNIYVIGGSDTSHLVIRYNTNGDSVWVRKYHLPSALFETALACTLDDSLNIIFTGRRRFSIPRDSLLVVKYSSSGVLRWVSVYTYDILVNIGTKITADQNGNVYIGGVTRVSGLGVYLTLKYDRNGLRQWAKIYYETPISGDNNLRGIAFDRINNALFVTGGAVANGVGVAATLKYNTLTGDSVWVRRDTGIYRNGEARDIIVDTLGNAYISGTTSNSGSGAAVDILTIKYSATGDLVWQVYYNGSFNDLDLGRAISIDNTSNVYILGYSKSSFQIIDYVLIKYAQLVGIQPLIDKTPFAFKLWQNYPNPFNASTKIRLSLPKSSLIQLKIFDVLGRIKEIPINEKMQTSEYELTVDASNYASGVYFYQLISDNRIIDIKKFVIIK